MSVGTNGSEIGVRTENITIFGKEGHFGHLRKDNITRSLSPNRSTNRCKMIIGNYWNQPIRRRVTDGSHGEIKVFWTGEKLGRVFNKLDRVFQKLDRVYIKLDRVFHLLDRVYHKLDRVSFSEH